MMTQHSAASPTLLPLVGRAAELAHLEAAMEADNAGTSIVFVRGEGGVGKSRLVAELADLAERRSWSVVQGRAYPVGAGVPYAVFADGWVPVLNSMESSTLTVLTRGGESELSYLFPALGDGSHALERSPSGEPDEFRTRLMWNFAEFLKRYASRSPLLCVLEDLQWADESSLELLHFVARQLSGAPVLFVGTYNDQERDACRALVKAERSLEAVGAGTVLHLHALTREHVGELVSRTFGASPDVVRDFAGVLYGWTRGNSFFIEAILNQLVSSGRLSRESGAWVGWDAKEFGMPASVRDAIMTRVAEFDDDTRTVLEMAAVLGSRVSFGVLESVTERDAAAVLRSVEALCSAGILEERSVGPDIVYDFRHPLVRQTLYDELGLQRGRILHGVVADAMESYYGAKAPEHADELAYHFARTDGHRLRNKAVEYLAVAGIDALARRADQEAIAYLESALERSGPADQDATRSIIPALARAHTHVGSFDSAARLWEHALDQLPEGDPERASILRALGMTNVWRGRHSVAAEHFDAGLDVARSAGQPAAVVRLLVAKAHGLHEVGEGSAALSVLAEALPLAEEIGDPGLLFAARDMRLYPNGQLAAHVLGGASFGKEGVTAAEVIGVAGVEKYFDDYLRDPANGAACRFIDIVSRRRATGNADSAPPEHRPLSKSRPQRFCPIGSAFCSANGIRFRGWTLTGLSERYTLRP